MSSNLQAVRTIYDAFGRADIATLLAQLSPDVRWDEFADSFAQRAGVPWLQARRGRDDVMKFLAVIAGWKISDFKVLDLIGDGRQMVAEIAIEAFIPDTGRTLREEELHLLELRRHRAGRTLPPLLRHRQAHARRRRRVALAEAH